MTSLTIYLCFKYSDRITERLGATGSDAISRIFAFILLCIGVQIFWAVFFRTLNGDGLLMSSEKKSSTR